MNDFLIAKYIRLSVNDTMTDSLSIPNQRRLLDEYIDNLNIANATVLEYVDNGYSGTNFERPAVQEMLELMRNGKINLIICKDFSRFGRNTIEVGYFIERVFPLYHVRFIAVSDNFDSNNYKDDTGGIDVAFKFLIHEQYSIDLSKKVKSAKRIQMLRGESIATNAIYGYRKGTNGKWEPDPYTAEAVKEIFKLALDGQPTSQIRNKMHDEQYPTPQEYIYMRRGKDIEPKCMWTARMVLSILDNEQYTGSYVSGKQEQKQIGSHSKIRTDKSEWIIIPDNHPPIVSKEDFAKFQELRIYRKGSTTTKPLQSDMSRPRRERMASGKSIAAMPIYGYVKTEFGNWEVDEVAGKVVREIYEMASQGLTFNEISAKLSEAGYPTPSEYIKRAKGHDIVPTNHWTVKCIRNMLKNEQYIGSYISGKILKDYESGKSYHTPKNEWIIIPDSHPPIVSKSLFYEVQEIISKNRIKRKNIHRREYLLYGKVVCGCCGCGMMYDDSTENNVYRCYHTYANPNAECHKLKINSIDLDNAVMSTIKKQVAIVLESEDVSDIHAVNASEQRITAYEKQIRQCLEQRQEIYEQFVQCVLDRETYLNLKHECSTKIEELEQQITLLKVEERNKQASYNAITLAKDVMNKSASPREIIETLVEKVHVFPDSRIEIQWRISDFAKQESQNPVAGDTIPNIK